MQADRQTNKHTYIHANHNTSYPYGNEVNNAIVSAQKLAFTFSCGQ